MDAADVIVVGAGSAGCVLAARLAAAGDRRVVLVEAGPDYGRADGRRWPADLLDASRDAMDSHVWGFPGGVAATRGKVVGGCSAINGCGILRARPDDYDAWDMAADGWSARTIAPYLARAERTMRARVTDVDDLDPWRRAFYEGAREVGLRTLGRFDDAGDDDGVGPIAMNVAGSTRISAAAAYLDPVRNRPNLSIVPDTLADRIVFEDGGAAGLIVHGSEGRREVRAGLVVLAAGAYASPAILVRSGIGPLPVLERLGIPAVRALPGVGEGLRDHPLVDVPLVPSESLARRLSGHASAGRAIAQVLLRAAVTEPWELQLGPWASDLGVGPRAAPFGHCGISVTLTTPRSSGRVRVTSSDPTVLPAVEHGFLNDGEGADARRLRAGVELAHRLARAPSIAAVAELAPQHAAVTRSAIGAWIEDVVEGNFHPVGTCRMGVDGDDGAVVDAAGRVFGVERLHVADASILPALPRANTHLTVLAVAERIADHLLAEPATRSARDVDP
jgi:choline dehydrogenase